MVNTLFINSFKTFTKFSGAECKYNATHPQLDLNHLQLCLRMYMAIKEIITFTWIKLELKEPNLLVIQQKSIKQNKQLEDITLGYWKLF